MKILKNKTHYTIKKGMGDVIIGEIIDYHNFKPVFHSQKDLTFGIEIDDLKFLLKEMEKLPKNYELKPKKVKK